MAGTGQPEMAGNGDGHERLSGFAGRMTTSLSTGALRLDGRENGPRGRSNGGFAAGTFAGLVGGTARVRLHAKVPLERDLVTSVEGGRAAVHAQTQKVATVEAVEPFVLEPPVRPSLVEAAAARNRHPLRGVRHPLSDCVVCGPERTDGLRVTPGPLEQDRDVLSAPFVPRAAFAEGGVVRGAAVWGALDCPSYPAAALRVRRFCLLGSLEAHQLRSVAPEERLVVVGWTTGAGRRSVATASAIIDESGDVVASARAVWVAVRHQWAAKAISRFAY
jgi:hypothetical protein